jgi:N-acetylmuramoyl-L-alanine amidase
MLRLGDSGAGVAEVRSRLAHLGLLPDAESGSIFDEELDHAVRSFQQERGLTVDGIVGPATYRRLDEARWQLGDRVLQFVPGHLVSGDDVAELQRRLSELGFDAGRQDGVFGRRTDGALRDFQRSVGVQADGTCGPETFRAFDRLVRTVSGGSAAELRELLAHTRLRTGVADKVVVLDPVSDRGADVCLAVAERVEGRLAALGTQLLLTRSAASSPMPDENARADFANRTGAHLVVSLDVDVSSSFRPNGVATFYFGDSRGGHHSYAGKRLAEAIQEAVTTRTDLRDCRSHPRTWDLLRSTRMPAVRVTLGYLSNPQDAAFLQATQSQDRLAGAIADAVRRFCSPEGTPVGSR